MLRATGDHFNSDEERMNTAPGGSARQIITGAQYVQQIIALESDRRTRSAFQTLAMSLVPPDGVLFDFGAGPGIDARFYAEHGFTVAAYDVDSQMRQYFAAHCRDLIEAGRVTLGGGDYREFLACKNVGGVGDFDLVTSNFAPLNLVDDVQELFAKFHALTGPRGRVLASVLSPYFVGDLKYGWWWRNVLRLSRDGHFFVQGAQARIVRRRLTDFSARSMPYFTLKRVFRGLPPSSKRDAEGVDFNGGARYAGLHMSTCRFMFLLFEKRYL
jgi:SAM-dependent methyltransferase